MFLERNFPRTFLHPHNTMCPADSIVQTPLYRGKGGGTLAKNQKDMFISFIFREEFSGNFPPSTKHPCARQNSLLYVYTTVHFVVAQSTL